jgi:3',5'-cyclic AMP phosphodiesterase CpdA
VTHHPFDLPQGLSSEHVVGRARLAMGTFAESRVDLFLAGHFHVGATGPTTERYPIESYSALIVSSGTSTSTRLRCQPNSLNVIQIDGARIMIDRQTWCSERGVFDLFSTERFSRGNNGWTLEDESFHNVGLSENASIFPRRQNCRIPRYASVAIFVQNLNVERWTKRS